MMRTWKKREARCMAFSLMAGFAVSSNVNAAGPGAVYTASNAASGNEVLIFERASNGELTFSEAIATDGAGAGMGLGNQGGVVLSESGKWLLVVNAGSNDVSVFRVKNNGDLVLKDVEPSGGILPISVTIKGEVVYVLNGGGAGNIAGFTLDQSGELISIPGAVQPLSGAPMSGPAQIQFAPDGGLLVVTEKATNLIDTYIVDGAGVAGPPMTNASAGMTPFGFGFSQQGYLIVSEAFGGAPDASALSSYAISDDGELSVVSASVLTTETAACWIVVTNNGRFTYTTNTGSGTISGYKIQKADGSLTLLDADGITAETGSGSMPIDAALSVGSKYLYVLNARTGEIIGFHVKKSNGDLTEVTVVGGLPPSANGLAAR